MVGTCDLSTRADIGAAGSIGTAESADPVALRESQVLSFAEGCSFAKRNVLYSALGCS